MDNSEALQKWNIDPKCHVFLLHAGTAAAGLTLTAACHVFLLEPFNCEGEELQSLNRTHRIGQTRETVCTTLYMRNSIEERLLAHRSKNHVNENDDNDDNDEGSSSDLTVLSAENASSIASDDLHLEYILGLSSGMLD